MDQSMTLLSAQVHFLDVELALIHIPLHLYNTFLQPILCMLLPSQADRADGTASFEENIYDHAFLNISVTPIECSVVCSRHLADKLFVPVRESLDETNKKQVAISKDNYIVMQVDGEGLDAGQRVVELTSPLAMNKIPLFFISTYFSDYILVPQPSRTTVISALEARGFAFESQTEAFVNIASPHASSNSRHNSAIFTPSQLSQYHPHGTTKISSSTLSLENPFERLNFGNTTTSNGHPSTLEPRPPPTPPPSSLEELETRTFKTLKRRNINPHVDSTIQLVQCAERRKPTVRSSTSHNNHTNSSQSADAQTTRTMRTQLSLVQCLIGSPRPSFFSLTLTAAEAASLLLERRLLANFGGGSNGTGMSDLLLGDPEEVLVPIILDLRDLPMESTGIVCGVAGRLVSGGGLDGWDDDDDDDGTPSPGAVGGAAAAVGARGIVEMSYLSTARAGTVIVAEAELERAMRALGRSG